MHLYFNVLGIQIPSYGLCIIIGVLLANVIACFVIKKEKLDFNDFIIMEAYCFIGAFLGAKVLYLFVSFHSIEWDRIFELQYFNQLMQSGFVFYGGLIGGLLVVSIAGKIHRMNAVVYIKKCIFLIPLIHCFGRIGCFMAGCCYGKPYDGVGAVVYPSNSLAPSGVKMFPVQLVEAFLLIVIAGIILYMQMKRNSTDTIEIYFGLYGVVRFCLEYLRYDTERGKWLFFSTSQWISILLILAVGISMIKKKKDTLILVEK